MREVEVDARIATRRFLFFIPGRRRRRIDWTQRERLQESGHDSTSSDEASGHGLHGRGGTGGGGGRRTSGSRAGAGATSCASRRSASSDAATATGGSRTDNRCDGRVAAGTNADDDGAGLVGAWDALEIGVDTSSESRERGSGWLSGDERRLRVVGVGLVRDGGGDGWLAGDNAQGVGLGQEGGLRESISGEG